MRREALARVMRFDAPADALLRNFLRAHPALGRRDRAWIADTVFDVVRHLRAYRALASSAHAARDDARPAPGDGSNAEADALIEVSDARRAGELDWALATQPLPFAIRYSLPDWLAEALLAQFPATQAEALAAALLEPAPLDLRVNALKADLARVRSELAVAAVQSSPLPQAPLALRVQGKPSLERTQAWAAGRFEVQDAGSQLLAMLVGARRGQTVIDLCAGAGGKTLALAAAMRSRGHLYACDTSAARLQRLRERLARSGADNVHAMAIDDERDARLRRLEGRADAVLVDAPCSGSGTLRRSPDLKWRMSAQSVEAFVVRQRSLLRAAASLVRPGGCLVYATCSLLEPENDAQLDWFESAYPGWTRCDAGARLAAQGARLQPEAVAGARLRLLPHRDDCDGFFAVRWQRGAARATRVSGEQPRVESPA